MTSIQEHIEEVVLKRISQGQIIDVYRMAKEIVEDLPGQPLEQVADVVSAAVIKGHGNALWQRE